jgi:hypothetical protein
VPVVARPAGAPRQKVRPRPSGCQRLTKDAKHRPTCGTLHWGFGVWGRTGVELDDSRRDALGEGWSEHAVRVFEWLERVRLPAVVSSYVSHRNSHPSYVARHPTTVLAAERRLRRMVSDRPQRLLRHQEASPLSRGDLERRLLSSSELAVYDFDDALQCDWGAGGVLRRVAPKGPKAFIAGRHADRVIAGNSVLAEWASQHDDDVIVIPELRVARFLPTEDRLRAMRAAPSRLDRIPAKRKVPAARGASPTRGPPADRRASHAHQHDALGIAPLADDPHIRGNAATNSCSTQLPAHPAVGSPIGVNREILSRLGLPAAGDDGEWVEAILDLLDKSAPARATL